MVSLIDIMKSQPWQDYVNNYIMDQKLSKNITDFININCNNKDVQYLLMELIKTISQTNDKIRSEREESLKFQNSLSEYYEKMLAEQLKASEIEKDLKIKQLEDKLKNLKNAAKELFSDDFKEKVLSVNNFQTITIYPQIRKNNIPETGKSKLNLQIPDNKYQIMIERLNEQLCSSNEQMFELSNKYHKLEEEYTNYKEESKNAAIKSNEQNDKINELKTIISTNDKEMKRMNAEIEELHQNSRKLYTENNQLLEEKENLEKENLQIQSQKKLELDREKKEYKILKTEYEEFTDMMTDINNKNTLFTEELIKLREELRSTEYELSSKKIEAELLKYIKDSDTIDNGGNTLMKTNSDPDLTKKRRASTFNEEDKVDFVEKSSFPKIEKFSFTRTQNEDFVFVTNEKNKEEAKSLDNLKDQEIPKDAETSSKTNKTETKSSLLAFLNKPSKLQNIPFFMSKKKETTPPLSSGVEIPLSNTKTEFKPQNLAFLLKPDKKETNELLMSSILKDDNFEPKGPVKADKSQNPFDFEEESSENEYVEKLNPFEDNSEEILNPFEDIHRKSPDSDENPFDEPGNPFG